VASEKSRPDAERPTTPLHSTVPQRPSSEAAAAGESHLAVRRPPRRPDKPTRDQSGQGRRALLVTRNPWLPPQTAPRSRRQSNHHYPPIAHLPAGPQPDQHPPSAGDLISTHSLPPPSSSPTTRTRHATRAPEREPGRVFGLALTVFVAGRTNSTLALPTVFRTTRAVPFATRIPRR